jgi:uncharacterized protein
MKIVIPGGTGQLGQILEDELKKVGHEVICLTRAPRSGTTDISWDGKTLGAWAQTIDGADVVINLAGRTVNCRYTEKNLKQMMDSRVDSTRVVAEAICIAKRPPRLWLQMSTATIYAHRYAAPNDEASGLMGGGEKGVPDYWAYSVEIARSWERELNDAQTPNTRKIAMRTAMVMAPQKDGVFDVLSNMTKWGLGGSIGGGRQFVSWIHYKDFLAAVMFCIKHEQLQGPINFTSPNPLPQRDFMAVLRRAMNVKIGLPATKWMAEIGAFFLRTDTELLLKSRRVTPAILPRAGFEFAYPDWNTAAADLVQARSSN